MVWVPKVPQNTMLTVQQGQKALLWRNLRPASRAKPWPSCAEPQGFGVPRLRCPPPSRRSCPPLLRSGDRWAPVPSLSPALGAGQQALQKAQARGVGGLPSTFAFALRRAWGERWLCGAKGVPETARCCCCWGIWVCKGCGRQKPPGGVWGGKSGEQQRTTTGAHLSC